MKRFGLVLIILLVGIVLTGCIVITAPDCCQPSIIITECNVTVVSISGDVYGEILINGEGTGEYFLPYQSYQSITISGILCNEVVVISIRDDCGYLSHEEEVYVVPGTNNNVLFSYWGPYGVSKEQQKGQNDCQGQNNCHKD